MCNGHSPHQQAQSLGHQRNSASTSAESETNYPIPLTDLAVLVVCAAGAIAVLLDVFVWKM